MQDLTPNRDAKAVSPASRPVRLIFRIVSSLTSVTPAKNSSQLLTNPLNFGSFIRLKDIHGSNTTLSNMVRIFRNNQSLYSSHIKQIFFWASPSRKIGIMSPESYVPRILIQLCTIRINVPPHHCECSTRRRIRIRAEGSTFQWPFKAI